MRLRWLLQMAAFIFLAITLVAPSRAQLSDKLRSLEKDPSRTASDKLGTLYRKTKNADERFWLVQTLGARLKDKADQKALGILVSVSSDSDANVRACALRSLASFGVVPDQALRTRWLPLLKGAAAKGAKDSALPVRQSAVELQYLLKRRSGDAVGKNQGMSAPSATGSWGWIFENWLHLFSWILVLVIPVMALAWIGRSEKRTRRDQKMSGMQKKNIIHTAKSPAASGPYSQAIESGGWVFVSGQAALDAKTGQLVGEDVSAQTRQALRNLEHILEAAGLSLRHVVKTTVYLRDMKTFAEMNEVYAESFPTQPPARATVEVSALPKGALVEIDAIARKNDF